MTVFMDPGAPSLWKMITDGGVLMGPYLIVVVLWGIAVLRHFVRSRSLKSWILLLVFPLAFIILAAGQWVLQWHRIHLEMARSGVMDPLYWLARALAIERSTLVIVGTAGVSLLVAVLAALVPTSGNSPER